MHAESITPPAVAEAALPLKEAISAVYETPTGRLQRIATETAIADGQNPYIFDLLVSRESQWDPKAAGDCTRGPCLAHGVAQFHESTFYYMKQKAIKAGEPYEDFTYTDSQDQLILMGWAFKNGMANQWGTYDRYYGLK